MEIKETVQKLLQEMVVPDLGKIKDENNKILAMLDLTNRRLDDLNTHLAHQSRRIDELRSELTQWIDEVHRDLTQRIDEVRSELTQRMDKNHADLVNRLDSNNARIDRFFLTSVTKEEHEKIDKRVARLERDVDVFRRQMAA